MKQTGNPEQLEAELEKAIRLVQSLKSSLRRTPSNRDLAEYNLGVARGIIHALEAMGYTDMVEQFKIRMADGLVGEPGTNRPPRGSPASIEQFFQRRLIYSRGKMR